MDFDLKKVISVLLHSTSQPIQAKTIQQVCARYHLEFQTAEPDSGEDLERAEDGGSTEKVEPAPTPSLPPVSVDAGDAADAGHGGTRVPSLVTQSQIREAISELQAQLVETRSAFRIIEGPNGFNLTCAPEFADWVRILRGEPAPLKLSPAALETVAIVAYRQPVTRAEMEAIRGVAVDGPLTKLLELDLVQAMGRADLPGRPIQYGTTDRFLEFCGIASIELLPASDILSNREVDNWLRHLNDGGETPDDDDVGLPPERKQGELPLDERFIEFPQSGNARS